MLNIARMPTAPPDKPSKPGLEPWQIEDANRLKTLFEKRAELTQARFGELHGIGTQGMVWQYLNARRPLNPKAAKAFADGLNVTLAEVSPTIAEQIQLIGSTATAQGTKPAELIEKCLNMTADEWAQMLEFADFLLSRRKKSQ